MVTNLWKCFSRNSRKRKCSFILSLQCLEKAYLIFFFFNWLVKCYKTAAWEFKAKSNYGHFIPPKDLPAQDFNKLSKFATKVHWNQPVFPSRWHFECSINLFQKSFYFLFKRALWGMIRVKISSRYSHLYFVMSYNKTVIKCSNENGRIGIVYFNWRFNRSTVELVILPDTHLQNIS